MSRVEWSRLRWRLRGAWQWPAFALAVVVEAVLLDALPVWGDGVGGLVPGLLLAASLNLVVVALVAPVAGLLLRHRRRDLPRAIASDYAGTALVGVLFLGLVAGGLTHRGELAADREARAENAVAVARFIRAREPGYAHGLAMMDIVRVEGGMYRTCVPGADPDRPLCLFVRTDQDPPAIMRDRDRAPNAVYRSRGGFN
jgi:hypothetical protein